MYWKLLHSADINTKYRELYMKRHLLGKRKTNSMKEKPFQGQDGPNPPCHTDLGPSRSPPPEGGQGTASPREYSLESSL